MIFNNTRFASKLVLLVLFCLTVPFASASILNNGGSVPPSPLTPGGPLLAMTSGVITTGTFSANYSEWVYSDPGNTFCSGCLDFVFQFKNNGPDILARFTFYNFTGFTLDVGTDPFGQHDPTTIDRSLSGAVVGFNYTPGDEIQPGQTTPMLVIETNARHFDFNGYLSAQDGTAGYGKAYEPAQPIPEPSSLGLFGSGLLAIGGVWRKLRSSVKL